MLSAFCFKLDQFKFLSSGNGLNQSLWKYENYCEEPKLLLFCSRVQMLEIASSKFAT